MKTYIWKEGFIIKGQEGKVYKLKKALYGLKQASLAWNKQANASLKSLGFRCCKSDSGIYFLMKNDGSIIVAILYVDDVIFMGNNYKLLMNLKSKFMKIEILVP